MKAILSLIISSALVVSGYSQTRNVLVGTNNAVVQPTNFWSADASNARTGLGLGTAATNPASAFQPSSLALSNLASNNGGALTNLQATNLVGLIPTSNIPSILLTNIGTITIAQGGTGATNAASARQNLGSTTVGDALFIATNAAAARTAIGATTIGSSVFTLVNPSAITFLRLNADNTATALSAADFRTALSLGTAATNPSSAFQPASSALTNLSTNNGANLTNIPVAGVVGALSTNGNGAGLTNLTAANITGTVALASNVIGTIAISNGGTGATNADGARANFGLGATNNAFVGLSVGTNNTNLSVENSSAFGSQNFIDTTADESFAFGGANKITNMPQGAGGSIVMGILGNMTNQGAFLFNGVPQGGTVGNSRGNNTFAVNASNGIYLNGSLFLEAVQGIATDFGILQIGSGGAVSRTMTNKSTAVPAFFGWNGFVNTAFSAAEARTNIGLSFAALTNTNASGFQAALFGTNTNPVLVNTNGEVVSPTNFWQVAPIQTVVQNLAPITNSTNAATNARNLYVYSLATNITGVTNTVTLPTNTSTFAGDSATIIHQGPTSSVTAVRQAGAGSNLITINRFDESVKFIYENNGWTTYHNISFQEPIYFSGTNASANAAASRTNLGLGTTNNVEFGTFSVGGDFYVDNGGVVKWGGSNGSDRIEIETRLFFGGEWTFDQGPIEFGGGTNRALYQAQTRTNLGIPLAALTNTSVTNFQKAIFYTNTAPSNIGGNLGTIAAWIEIVASNGVTYKIPAYTNVP